MKLLISAYACAPNRGSEHGSGWNWVIEASRLGHELCVLVSPAHRESISTEAGHNPHVGRISWVFPEVAAWPLQQSEEPVWERTYNLLWQLSALKLARRLQCEVGFDAVHHLTWGGIRAPTFLGALGIPLIIGPVGGGETAPRNLRDRLPLRGRLLEYLRDLSNNTVEFNPILRPGLHNAAVIFAKTADTRNLLSPRLRAKTLLRMELGIDPRQISRPRALKCGPPKLLYAGRLLYWKGVHIGLEAMAGLVARIPEAQLTIVGNGPEEARLKTDVAGRNLEGNVTFAPRMPQKEFMRLYDSHDMLLFPSLHDSSGCVVLEALCRGMPVACLDVGGPKDIVTPRSGIIVNTKGLTTTQVAAGLADQLYEVFSSPERLAALSVGAIERANEFHLSDQVTQLYDEALGMLAGGTMADRKPLSSTSTVTAGSAALV